MPHLQPMAAVENRMRGVWWRKKIRSDLNAKAERRSYLPGLGMNVTLRLRRLWSSSCSFSSSISSSSKSPVID